MVDKIDIETDRRQAELINAFSKPASVYFSPTLQIQADTISKATSGVSSVAKRSGSVPVLDMPKDAGPEVIDAGLEEMKGLIQKYGESALDELVQLMFMDIQSTTEEHLAVKKAFFQTELKFSEHLEKQRLLELQKQVSTSQKAGTWNTVEKALVSFGLIAAGVAGISMGLALGMPLLVGIGATAIAVGTLMVIDQLLEDRAKKAIASWMAKDSKEDQEIWLSRIHTFLTVTSFALSMGLAVPAASQYGIHVATKFGAKLALSVAQGAAGGIKSVYEMLNNNHKSQMITLDAACTLSQKSVEMLLAQIREICNTMYKLYDDMHNVEKNTVQLWQQLTVINT